MGETQDLVLDEAKFEKPLTILLEVLRRLLDVWSSGERAGLQARIREMFQRSWYSSPQHGIQYPGRGQTGWRRGDRPRLRGRGEAHGKGHCKGRLERWETNPERGVLKAKRHV